MSHISLYSIPVHGGACHCLVCSGPYGLGVAFLLHQRTGTSTGTGTGTEEGGNRDELSHLRHYSSTASIRVTLQP